MARSRPRKVSRYGDQFKPAAVRLSSLPGVLIQDVAAALDIHLFLLPLWRKAYSSAPNMHDTLTIAFR